MVCSCSWGWQRVRPDSATEQQHWLVMLSIFHIPVDYLHVFFGEMCIQVLSPCLFLLNFLFCIGVQSINNAGIVLGGQQRDSAIHTHV